MKNDEILIAERIKELKEENMKLKDKVEGLQDRIDSAINYIEYNAYSLIQDIEIMKLLDILNGDNNE